MLELAKNPRHQRAQAVARECEPQRVEAAGSKGLKISLRAREPGPDRARMLDHDLACTGQADRLRSSGAIDEPLTNNALECRDLLAHGRLRVPQLFRSAIERSLSRDRLKRQEVSELDADPSRRPKITSSKHPNHDTGTAVFFHRDKGDYWTD